MILMTPPVESAFDEVFVNSNWRYAAATFSLIVVCLTVFRYIYWRKSKLPLYRRFKMFTEMLVFSLFTYASLKALNLNLPPHDYNAYLAIAMALYASALVWPMLDDVWRRQKGLEGRPPDLE